MTNEKFNEIQDGIFQRIKKIGATKGKEYAHDDDRLANFKRLAKEFNCRPSLICLIYARKHYDSIISYYERGEVFSNESIESRFDDYINYITLLYSCLVDEKIIETYKGPCAYCLDHNHYGCYDHQPCKDQNCPCLCKNRITTSASKGE